MKNPKKYSFLISKNFYILKFEKKSVTFFSAKNFFCDIFLAENVFPKNPVFHYNSQHTHIKNCVCVETFLGERTVDINSRKIRIYIIFKDMISIK